MISHLNRLAAEEKAVIAIDAPYYLRGKAVVGPLPTDAPSLLPSSREPAVTPIAPVPEQEPPAQEQPLEEVSTEEGSNEVPLGPEAQPAEYNVSEGDPVKDATNQTPAPDTFIIPESTD